MSKRVPFLWFDGKAKETVGFYSQAEALLHR